MERVEYRVSKNNGRPMPAADLCSFITRLADELTEAARLHRAGHQLALGFLMAVDDEAGQVQHNFAVGNVGLLFKAVEGFKAVMDRVNAELPEGEGGGS